MTKPGTSAPDTPTSRPDRTALGFLSSELWALAALSRSLEDAVGAVVSHSPRQDRGAIMALQHLDLLRQSLEDLARLSQALCRGAEDPPWHPPASAFDALRLGDLRRRLQNGQPPPAHPDAPDDGGDPISFFRMSRDASG